MRTLQTTGEQRFLLEGVSWRSYGRLLREFRDRHLRLTFDEGALEIMTLSHEHENLGRFLGRLAVTLTEELDLPIKEGGSTTFRRRPRLKGLEPDNCYWIANEAKVRGKKKLNLRRDPPPDLAIEIDIFHSSLDRMSIYAALRVPEVWRYDRDGLKFFVLEGDAYVPSVHSLAFPQIAAADLESFLQQRGKADENSVIRRFRKWVRGKHGA